MFSVGGCLAAAENPFAGTWKFNPAKSKLTGDTMTFEETASGAIRWSGSGVSYTFKEDDKEYEGPVGMTVAWKQVNDTTWETAYRQKGILLSTDTTKLSPDGKTMTIVRKRTKPSGEAYESTVVYGRISGDRGLMGRWKNKQVKVGSPRTIEIKSAGEDGLILEDASHKTRCDAQFDGKDYPVTGPTVSEGTTLSLTHAGPRSFKLVMKKDGKPLVQETYKVSQDGRVLTVTGSPVAVNEPYTEVYERQER
jgi:uncharacterized OB-fold protein